MESGCISDRQSSSSIMGSSSMGHQTLNRTVSEPSTGEESESTTSISTVTLDRAERRRRRHVFMGQPLFRTSPLTLTLLVPRTSTTIGAPPGEARDSATTLLAPRSADQGHRAKKRGRHLVSTCRADDRAKLCSVETHLDTSTVVPLGEEAAPRNGANLHGHCLQCSCECRSSTRVLSLPPHQVSLLEQAPSSSMWHLTTGSTAQLPLENDDEDDP